MAALIAAFVAVLLQDPVGPALPPEALQAAPAPAVAPESSPKPAVYPDIFDGPVQETVSARLIPPPEFKPVSRKLAERPDSGPSLGGFLLGSFVVMALLGGTFVLLKRYGRGSRFLGGGGAINVLSKKALGPRQDVFLVEVGTKVFLIGSTRDQMTTLGEFSNPDDVAVLRSNLPGRKEESAKIAFRQSLKEGIEEEEAPEPVTATRVFDSIAGELAEIRKTVHGWRA